MNKITDKINRAITFVMVIAVLLQNIHFVAAAQEGNSNELFNAFSDKEAEMFENLVYSDETTEQILDMTDKGLNLEDFFEGELVKDITKEDLVKWKEEGRDINEVVLERARERSATVKYANSVRAIKKMAPVPDSDGKYYLTECDKPADKGEVNLEGTIYSGELFNPKNNGGGESTPWFISLGGDEAMCVTYNGFSSKISKSHSYKEADINHLKDNPYFKGGSSYPVEGYLKGACYAYETLYHYEDYHTSALDADCSELVRKTNENMVRFSGRDVNYSVLQILTWRIAQGSFNPNNLAYEQNLAKTIYLQMYPEDTWGTAYSSIITSFYEYYVTCAIEAASGEYTQKYSTTQVKYWEVQGSNSQSWQDFITWDLSSVPVRENIEINKEGIFTDSKFPDAVFEIYSDEGLTKKIGSFTTDSNGTAKINAIEGIYYLKETKAPKGAERYNGTIILTVKDATSSKNIPNSEVYNYISFSKYDKNTQRKLEGEGSFAIYEWNTGRNRYLKMGNFIQDDTGKYILKDGENGTLLDYHSDDGSVYISYKTNRLYYSTANQGKFKIVEEKAPEGYQSGSEKELTINTDVSGYTINFNHYSTGIMDEPLYFNIFMIKSDTLTADQLGTAEFKLQEYVNSTWYDVGELVYNSTLQKYMVSAEQSYSYHTNSGSIAFVKSATDYPLCLTSYNNGKFRIIETKLPNENYSNYYVKTFVAKPTSNHYTYSFDDYTSGAKNRGKGVRIATRKFDAITKEEIRSDAEASAVITVYEYNNADNHWYELGDLKKNALTGRYETDNTKFYTPHNEDGSLSTASVGKDYSQGQIYYTSVNRGRFKLVETVQPLNYLRGTLNLQTLAENIYEREFYIDESVENGKLIDLTDIEDAAKDTGKSVNCVLAKYDVITRQKADTNNAVFEVYEKIEGKWYSVGTMIYDEADNVYKTSGMGLTLHNSIGREIYTEASAHGLYYTTANKGTYKVVEKVAPDYYTIGRNVYEREFNIADYRNGEIIPLTDFLTGAKDIGIKGKLEITKYDAATEELVRTGDTVITVYEKIGEQYFAVGVLKYNSDEKKYSTIGSRLTYHDSDGNIVPTDEIDDFENGWLYYTAANHGQYRVVETQPPSYYTLTTGLKTPFIKEFTITEEGQEFIYQTYTDAIKNFGKTAYVYVKKYDIMTKQEVEQKNTGFVVQEYITDKGEWLDVTELKYSAEMGGYVSNGAEVVLHGGNGEIKYRNGEGKLYYTTQNLGKYRVVEKSAPTCYTNGTTVYIKEFDITKEGAFGIFSLSSTTTIHLEDYENSAKNLGNYAVVEAAKYDDITREKVKTPDTEFTVYEKIGSEWMEVGKLFYNTDTHTYTSEEVTFVFHDENGEVIATENIPDFAIGRLYYTTANDGQYKLAETKPPVYYEEGSYEKEFTITDNAQKFSFVGYENGAKNEGFNVPVKLKKYDAVTKTQVFETDAEFDVQEYISDANEWLTVCTLVYDEDNEEYSTDGVEVMVYHDSAGDVIDKSSNHRIAYTTANQGRYRVIERKQPSHYEKGSVIYNREFNITTDLKNGMIDLRSLNDGAKNIGINGIVKVSKFDSITKEKVVSGDAEFTVYEYIYDLDQWLSMGTLKYDQAAQEYSSDSDEVELVYHDAQGNVIERLDVTDYKHGKLYYTTTNRGKFKVVETKAPSNYLIDGFEEEFDLSDSSVGFRTTSHNDGTRSIEFNSAVKGAYDTGINGSVTLKKADSIYDTPVAGAVFAVQEWSENLNTWLEVGELKDNKDGTYATAGMMYKIHTGLKQSMKENVTMSSLTYTTQNKGRFRIVEKQAPKGYLNDMYISPVLTLEDTVTAFELKDETKATDTPIRVSISKKSVTTGKEIIGAKLTVKNKAGELIDSWTTDGKEHIIAAIEPGHYELIEERAPTGYVAASKIEFEVKENNEIQRVEMYDEEITGRVIINKTDSITDEQLEGARFELTDEEGNVIDTLVTDADGHAASKNIPFGLYGENGQYLGSKKYKLIEKQAPAGYTKSNKSIEFEFDAEHDMVDLTALKEFNIQNDREPGVETGDSVNKKTILLMIFAVIIIAVLGMSAKLKEETK